MFDINLCLNNGKTWSSGSLKEMHDLMQLIFSLVNWIVWKLNLPETNPGQSGWQAVSWHFKQSKHSSLKLKEGYFWRFPFPDYVLTEWHLTFPIGNAGKWFTVCSWIFLEKPTTNAQRQNGPKGKYIIKAVFVFTGKVKFSKSVVVIKRGICLEFLYFSVGS